PCSTTKRVATGSHRPPPAVKVSWIWDSTLSVASSTAAIPPCAQALALSARARLVTSATRRRSARRKASDCPAVPLPSIKTSYVLSKLIAFERRFLRRISCPSGLAGGILKNHRGQKPLWRLNY